MLIEALIRNHAHGRYKSHAKGFSLHRETEGRVKSPCKSVECNSTCVFHEFTGLLLVWTTGENQVHERYKSCTMCISCISIFYRSNVRLNDYAIHNEWLGKEELHWWQRHSQWHLPCSLGCSIIISLYLPCEGMIEICICIRIIALLFTRRDGCR